ncbi:MAG: selenocysteine-specific translation elongation factor [Acidimicrobiia bacterium]
MRYTSTFVRFFLTTMVPCAKLSSASADMPIVGTAGHVDHGKSTLVHALTGTDPDRWAEEKQRGLTIDLGFAWAEIEGHDVGFVDVPGHERFIKNMLAGVGVVDCALLVVAADSGWMPQTEEHAAVLDLLDVAAGIVVLTRTDLVDEDTVELATLEVLDETAGTRLEDWPVIAVSAVTGEGLEELRMAIASHLSSNGDAHSAARLWVDRSFQIAGAGLVATGTVMSGTISEGDTLALHPSADTVRIRGVQHHGGSVGSVTTGDRTALSFTGSHDVVERGSLLATEGTVRTTDRALLILRPTRQFDAIPDRGAFHLHLGTASRPTRLRRLEGDTFLATFDELLPAVVGDRVIVRDSGRKAVVGGGRVLDPDPPDRPQPTASALLASVLDSPPDVMATELLTTRGESSSADLAADTLGGVPLEGLVAHDRWISTQRAHEVEASLIAMVSDYHEANPVRPGLPKAEAAAPLGVSVDVVDAVVAQTTAVEESEGAIRLEGFRNELSDAGEAAWASFKPELEAGFDVPRMSSFDLDDDTVHFLLRRGDLVRIGDDLAFSSDQIDSLVAGVADLEEGFAVTEFKDHFGMSRRQAVPTLEWLDSIGRTRRSGDGRVVRDVDR